MHILKHSLTLIFISICIALNAQLSISATGLPATVEFTTYNGSGLSTTPGSGQLNSNTWRVTGLSDGDTQFGDEATSGDYARGASTGAASSGGLYAFDTGVLNGNCYGWQVTGGDYSPGATVLKIENNTGDTIRALQIDYDIMVNNDQERANSVNLSYAYNDVDYTAVAALDYTSPEASDANGWTVVDRSFLLSNITINPGALFYLRWESDDISGSGSRDELGIDNISLTAVETGNDPIVSFAVSSDQVTEDGGSYTIVVSIDDEYETPTSVEVHVDGGTATNASDFIFVNPTTLVFPANSSADQTVSVTINDDEDDEGIETIDFTLENPTNNASIGNGNLTVSIIDNDKVIPTYSIDQINNIDSNGDADSAGVYCRLGAVVLGVNLRDNGLQFFMNDFTGGIQVFSANEDFNYTVNEGDSIRVVGTIGQFNGQLQMTPDSIAVVATPVPLPQPIEVSGQLNESHEGELVLIKCKFVDNLSDWDNSEENGFNVSLAGGNVITDVRVDDASELFNSNAPDFTFNIVGVVGQFDSSDPRDEGYQVYPFYTTSIQDTLKAAFSFETSGRTVDFTSTSIGATGFSWDFDDLESSIEESPIHTYDEDGNYQVILTVTNAHGCINELSTLVPVSTIGLSELETSSWQVYPSMATTQIIVHTNGEAEQAWIVDAMGKVVLETTINQPKQVINVHHLPLGIYYMKLCTGATCVTKKWIK